MNLRSLVMKESAMAFWDTHKKKILIGLGAIVTLALTILGIKKLSNNKSKKK